MIRTSILGDGLRVVTEKMPNVESVAIGFWVGTGSRDETDADWGTSHFLEHLLFKGTTSRSALDIARSIDRVGGDMNAFTTKELTAFYVRVVQQEVGVGLEVLCDIMSNPAFDPNEIGAERNVVLEEILMRGDEPGDLVHEIYDTAVYEGHPLSREILGDEAAIMDMTPEDIRTFFSRHYVDANMVVAAAGNLDHDRFVEQLQGCFASRKGSPRADRVAPTPATGVRVVNNRPTDQAHLVVGFPAVDRHSKKRYASALLDVILGGGMSSRLFQSIREQRGLAYTVFSSFTPYDDTGSMSVYLGSAPERVAEAYEVLLAELNKAAAGGITAQELELAKRNLHANTVLNLEDSGSRMSRIGRSLLQHGSVLDVSEVTRRIEAVTVDEVEAIARECFSVEPNVAVVGPVDDQLRAKKKTVAVA